MLREKPVTSLAELAKLAGVSTSTVSRALSGNSLIGDATRSRIMALAQEHGFRLNQTARNLRLKRTQAIAVVLPLGHETDQHLSDPFFMSLLGPLADALTEREHDLLLSRVIPTDDRWLNSIADSGRVDGVIVIGQSDQIDVIERVAGRYRPMVVWGAREEGYDQLTVGSENKAGGNLAALHLLRRGCRRIAFFGNPDIPEFAARYAGFRQAMQESDGAAFAQLLPVHLTTEAAYSETAAFLAQNQPPDGIVAASDVIAMSAIRALAERGLSVPNDVAVIGYDDVSVARYTTPPLTTIRQDVVGGARLLVELLFRRLAGDEPQSVTMKPELVLRASA